MCACSLGPTRALYLASMGTGILRDVATYTCLVSPRSRRHTTKVGGSASPECTICTEAKGTPKNKFQMRGLPVYCTSYMSGYGSTGVTSVTEAGAGRSSSGRTLNETSLATPTVCLSPARSRVLFN